MDAGGPRAESLNPFRAGILISAAVIAGAAAAAFGLERLPGEMRDFEVYWTAAARALSAEPLYRPSDGHFQFKYLPAFAVVTAPVALVPLAIAKSAWFVISVALLLALLALSLSMLPLQRRPGWLLVAGMIVAMGKFYGHELTLGQVNLLFAVTVCAGIVLLGKGNTTAAAVLLVFAVVVKPYAVLLLPWLAFRGRTPAIVTATAALAAVLLLPVVLYGVEGTIALHQAWWVTVTESTAPNLTNADNVSLAGFFAKWVGGGRTAAIGAAGGGAALIALIVVVILRGKDVPRREMLEGALLLTAIPLLTPQGWDYVFLVATPAIALFLNYDDELPLALRVVSWGAVLTIGLSLFDILGRARYAAFMSWSVITVCFVVIIAALAALRVRRVA